jgi:hypothetical protein
MTATDQGDFATQLRDAVRSLLATPRESVAFQRRRRLARRLLAAHPELRTPLDWRTWTTRQREARRGNEPHPAAGRALPGGAAAQPVQGNGGRPVR